MRMYMNFEECREEIKRDLAEMGHVVKPKSYQNKVVEGNPDFETKELRNYVYTIIEPSIIEVSRFTDLEWCKDEASERFGGERLNPGEAYKHREELWNTFMVDGKQDYTYPERFNPVVLEEVPEPEATSARLWEINQIDEVVEELSFNPDTRQCYISIWEPGDIRFIGGQKRVPCTLGYQVMIRDEELHINYIQRSCDFVEHYSNDVFLALALANEISNRIFKKTGKSYSVGSFTHFVTSMHIYRKDIEGVF